MSSDMKDGPEKPHSSEEDDGKDSAVSTESKDKESALKTPKKEVELAEIKKSMGIIMDDVGRIVGRIFEKMPNKEESLQILREGFRQMKEKLGISEPDIVDEKDTSPAVHPEKEAFQLAGADITYAIEKRKLIEGWDPVLAESIKTGNIYPPLLYRYPDLWIKLSEALDKIEENKGLLILKSKFINILQILFAGKIRNLELFDLGIGRGYKAALMIQEAINDRKRVTFKPVDASPLLLNLGIKNVTERLLKKLFKANYKGKSQHLLAGLKKFCDKEGLSKISGSAALKEVQERRCLDFYSGEKFDLCRHLIAATLGLSKGGKTFKLDTQVDMPLEFYPQPSTFENADLAATDKEKTRTLYTLLGNTGGNYSLEELLGFINKILPEENVDISNKESIAESDLNVPALLLGMHARRPHRDVYIQEGEKTKKINPLYKIIIDPKNSDNNEYVCMNKDTGEVINTENAVESLRLNEAEANRILSRYTLEEFIAFVKHPLKKDVVFIDSDSGEEFFMDDVGTLSVEYGEDERHSGLFRVMHNFTLKRNVHICIGKPDAGGEYPYLVKKNKGDVICLHYSYKYTTEQLMNLMQQNGFKVIGGLLKYPQTKASHIKMLVRRKLDNEIERRVETPSSKKRKKTKQKKRFQRRTAAKRVKRGGGQEKSTPDKNQLNLFKSKKPK